MTSAVSTLVGMVITIYLTVVVKKFRIAQNSKKKSDYLIKNIFSIAHPNMVWRLKKTIVHQYCKSEAFRSEPRPFNGQGI